MGELKKQDGNKKGGVCCLFKKIGNAHLLDICLPFIFKKDGDLE